MKIELSCGRELNLHFRGYIQNMTKNGTTMAPKMEAKSAQERLRGIREGVHKSVLELGSKMCENGGPQGSPKSVKKWNNRSRKGSKT